jgi:predicted transcriptional regulator
LSNLWRTDGRRSNVQIAAAVLKLTNTRDTTQAELKDCVKMSHRQTQRYLEWLVERQLLNIIEINNHRRLYRSTPKGQNLVSIIDEVQRLLKSSDARTRRQSAPDPK